MADKKISELPLINTVSGSIVYVPIVHDGITEKITIQNFSKYTSQYSAHTGSAGNTFTGPQIINSNVTINGRLTVTEVVAQYETASILFSTGSTKLGDQLTDKHEFTGSTNITGSLNYNGVLVTNIDADTIHRLQQTTASLNFFTASQIGKDGTLAEVTSSLRYFYQTTSSLHAFTASQIGQDGTLAEVTSSLRYFYQTTSSLHAFTASQIGKDGTLAEVTSSLRYFYQTTSSLHAFTASQIGQVNTLSIFTSSINAFTGSQIGKDGTLAEVTSSLRYFYQTTSSIHAFTASQIGKDFTLSIVTSSIDAHILKQATQTGSQDLVNLGISSVTGSLIGITNGLMAFTAALDNTYATDAQLYQLYQATASLNTQTGSQSNLNAQIGIATSSLNSVSASLIGITNGLMAFTAALDSTYATDAQLYQLYQATASIQFATASLNTQTGSQNTINFNISVVTSSIDAHILKQSTQTGSQDLVNLGISTFTGSLRSEVNLIEAYTASLKAAAIVSSSTQVQNYDVFALNSNLYNSTGSIKGEIAGIEAYTASLKGAAIVSSSQQITNYYKFAETASANTFYSTNTFYNTSSFLGVMGIGTSLPLSKFEVYAGSDATSNTILWGQTIRNQGNGAATGYGAGLKLKISSDGEPYKWAGIAGVAGTGYSNQTDLVLYTAATSVADATEKVRVSGDGYLRLATKGIQFNGDTADANSLDDYEEGTWTPTLTTSGGTPPTVVSSSGRYIIVGKLVTIYFKFLLSSASGGSGQLKITNAPLTLNTATIPAVGFARILDTGTTLNCGFLTGTVINFNKYDGGYAGTDYETVGQVSYYND